MAAQLSAIAPAAATLRASKHAEEEGDKEAKSCEALIEDIGIGWFHYMAALICGIGNASDAVELLCISFILPELGTEVSDRDKSLLSASVFIGMLVGGLFAGSLSDRWGRKPLLLFSLGVNAVFGAISAATTSWAALAACRVVAGVGVGGSVPGVFTLMVEYLPTARRGAFISAVAWFWMVGTIFCGGAAWLLLGHYGVAWQVFAGVCAIPAGSAFFMTLLLLPESPRYLYATKSFAAAARSLQYMAGVNGRAHATRMMGAIQASKLLWESDRHAAAGGSDASSTAGISGGETDDREILGATAGTTASVHGRHGASSSTPRGLEIGTPAAEDGSLAGARAAAAAAAFSPQPNRGTCAQQSKAACSSSVSSALQGVRDFFDPSLRRTSVLLLIVWFALSFGWYGLTLWIPSLFNESDVSFDPFQDAFITAAANLPGNLFATLLMDVIGRKRMLAVSLVLACICALCFAFAQDRVFVILSACFLNAVSCGSWNALDCLSTESFPTRLRTSAMGFLAASGRIGSIIGQLVFGALVKVSKPGLLGTASAMLLVGGIASFLLPNEPTGRKLADFVGEQPPSPSSPHTRHGAPAGGSAGGGKDESADERLPLVAAVTTSVSGGSV